MKQDNQVTVAITGASGAPYALRLIQCLLDQDMGQSRPENKESNIHYCVLYF